MPFLIYHALITLPFNLYVRTKIKENMASRAPGSYSWINFQLKTVEEATELISVGFEYVTKVEG